MNDLTHSFEPVEGPVPAHNSASTIVVPVSLTAADTAYFQAIKRAKKMNDLELISALSRLALGVIIRSEGATSDEPVEETFQRTITGLSLEKKRASALLAAHEKVLVDARALHALLQKILSNGGNDV